MQARSQADADAVGQRLFVGVLRIVQVVRSEYGELFVVVAGVDDLRHRIAHPVGRLRGPEFVKDQNLGVIDGLQNLQLGQLRNRVVAVLNFFEQIAEIIEEAWDALNASSLTIAVARCVLPTPQGPRNNNPTSMAGY